MSPQDYVNLLGNGFFPMIMCGFLLWSQHKNKEEMREIIKEYKETINDMSNKHEQTLVSIAETLSLMNERIKDIEMKGYKDERTADSK